MLSPMLLLTLIAVLAALVAAAVKRIPEGQVYTLRRFDGHARTLGSGVHFMLPLLERIVHRIPLTGRALSLDEDLRLEGRPAPVKLSGTVYWQVLDAQRADALVDHAEEFIRSHTISALRAHPADHEAADARNQRLKHTLNGSLRERGVLVTRVQLHLH